MKNILSPNDEGWENIFVKNILSPTGKGWEKYFLNWTQVRKDSEQRGDSADSLERIRDGVVSIHNTTRAIQQNNYMHDTSIQYNGLQINVLVDYIIIN